MYTTTVNYYCYDESVALAIKCSLQIKEDVNFSIFSSDILPHWICILLHRDIDQRMGDSGQKLADTFRFQSIDPWLSENCVYPCLNHVQQVYMYFRGTGKTAEMRKEAMMAAL